MYRVELKDHKSMIYSMLGGRFLMYRVELKGIHKNRLLEYPMQVPNVPCGVESLSI